MKRNQAPNLYEHCGQIRGLISSPRKQWALLKALPMWRQLCSSLDAIEDSQQAIESYLKLKPPQETGAMYLAIYGVFQAFSLQQDAVDTLCMALGIKPISRDKRLQEVRELRNDIEHQTKRKGRKGKPISFHPIVQARLEPGGLELLSYYGGRGPERRRFDVRRLANDQEHCLTEALQEILEHLEAEMAKHKAEFKDQRLADCFHESWGYLVSKLWEGAYYRDEMHIVAAYASLGSLQEMLKSFRQALEKRGIELATYDTVKYLYEELEYPLEQLGVFLEALRQGKQPLLDPKAAMIFAWFVAPKFKEVVDVAKALDTDYAECPS